MIKALSMIYVHLVYLETVGCAFVCVTNHLSREAYNLNMVKQKKSIVLQTE